MKQKLELLNKRSEKETEYLQPDSSAFRIELNKRIPKKPKETSPVDLEVNLARVAVSHKTSWDGKQPLGKEHLNPTKTLKRPVLQRLATVIVLRLILPSPAVAVVTSTLHDILGTNVGLLERTNEATAGTMSVGLTLFDEPKGGNHRSVTALESSTFSLYYTRLFVNFSLYENMLLLVDYPPQAPIVKKSNLLVWCQVERMQSSCIRTDLLKASSHPMQFEYDITFASKLGKQR